MVRSKTNLNVHKLITGFPSLGEEESMDLSEQTTPTPMKSVKAMDQDRLQVC